MAPRHGIQLDGDRRRTPAVEQVIHEDHTRLMEQMLRMRDEQSLRNEQMKSHWLLLTGESMDSRDLELLQRNLTYINETMDPNHFERLKTNWTLLTNTDPTDLEQIIRDMRPYDFEKLKKDYLVLNWANMSSEDFEQFKKNWLVISGGTAEQENNIIKRWVLLCMTDIFHMRHEDKFLFIRRCLKRGADVNAVSDSGYSLLHMMVSYIYPPLIELLLSYGADVTLREPTGETPLEIVRTHYYKDHEDIVSMLQTAEKPARKNILLSSEGSLKIDSISESQLEETKLKRDQVEIQNWWIEANEPSYLIRASKLFDHEDADIDNLMLSVINYMYVSKIQKTELKFNQPVDRYEKITKIHQMFSKMCSKLFNIFDAQFNQSINIEFSRDTMLSESAELVFLLEIHPEVEWVALKIYAVPWDIQYYVYCRASSKSRFLLGQELRNSFSICSSNLLCDYEKYLGERQKRLINWYQH